MNRDLEQQVSCHFNRTVLSIIFIYASETAGKRKAYFCKMTKHLNVLLSTKVCSHKLQTVV